MSEDRRRCVLSLLAQAEVDGLCAIPSTRADAAALKRLSGRGGVIAPMPGLYVRARYWDSLAFEMRARHLIRSLSAKHPSWIFTHGAAALIHGLEVPYGLLCPLRAISSAGKRYQGCSLLDLRRARQPEAGDICLVDGVRATAFWRTVVDCMLSASFAHALAIADSALRVSGMPRDYFIEFVESAARGRHGAAHALMVAEHADGRAENGGESQARAVMIEQGFALPELQVELPDITDGGRTFRVDQFWILPDGRGCIGELDGKMKYADPEMLGEGGTIDALAAERQRESRLTLLGYPVVRYTFDDVVHPERLVRLLVAAGVPRSHELAESWRERWARSG